MNWESDLELAANRAGFWFIHLNQVALWVLAALAAFLFLLRLVTLRVFRPALLPHVGRYPGRGRLDLYAALALLALAFTSYEAIRPDPHFHATLGQAALVSGDDVGVVTYYQPLVDWSSPDLEVYLDLARAYLRLGNPRRAVAVLERALVIRPGSTVAHVLCAEALVALGRTGEGVDHLRRASEGEPAGPLKEAILERMKALETPSAPTP